MASERSRAAVLVLSGDAGPALEAAQTLEPTVGVGIVLEKRALREGGLRGALGTALRHRVDVLIVQTDDRSGSEGRPILDLVAAAFGASRLVLVDASGTRRQQEVRPVRSAIRLGRESIAGLALCGAVAGSAAILARIARRGRSRRRASNGDRALRICYVRSVGHVSQPSVGGVASHAIGLTRALADLGHRVQVLTRPPGLPVDHPAVSVSVTPFDRNIFTVRPFVDLENHLRFTVRAWRRLKHDPPDVLFHYHRRFDVSGALLSVLLDRPLLLEHEGSEELPASLWNPTRLGFLLRATERLDHRQAGSIFALTEVIKEDLIRNRAVEPDRIVVMPTGVDTKRFRPMARSVALRRRLGIEDDEVVAGFTGSFGPWHGTRVIARAAHLLPPGLRLRFLFVGEGDYRSETESSFADGPYPATFVGRVQLHEVPRFLSACDILLCPTEPLDDGSEFYGSPTKLFEYIAVGRAVVASRLGQIAEVIDDGVNGVLIEPGDEEELAGALARLVREPGLRRRLGARARKDAVRLHDWHSRALLLLAGAGSEHVSLPEGRGS